MITSSDLDYLDTKLIKKGSKQLSSIFQELAEWINKKYDTQALNIYYDTIEVDNNRPRLNIIFEHYPEAAKFKEGIINFDPAKQAAITEAFRNILSKNKTAAQFNTDKLWVIFDSFENVAKEEANGKIPQTDIDQLLQESGIKELWKIYRQFSSTTFFFFTTVQIEQLKNSEAIALLKRKYFDLLKKQDEFDYFKSDTFNVAFDSKENFDTNYESNWFYYSR